MSIDARRPRVLASIRDWSPELAASNLEVIRAHLRGLGAVLTIAAQGGAWSIAPDDKLRPATPDELEGIVPGASDRDAVLVLDGAGSVRFSHAADAPLTDALVTALGAATDALFMTRPSEATFNRREWKLACLCTGFGFALLSSRRKAPRMAELATQAPAPLMFEVVVAASGGAGS
jgi:hypothetical protein